MTASETSFTVRSAGQRLSHLHAVNGVLLSCCVSQPESPHERVQVDGLTVSNCRHDGCFIHGAIVQNSTVSDLRGSGRLGSWLRGCLYENVRLRGKLSGIEIRSSISESSEIDELFRQHAEAFYASVSIALDISEASFDGFNIIEGVPANLVRLNPEEHFVFPSSSARELPAQFAWLKIVAKAALVTQGGVVFSLNGKSERAKRNRAECLELRQIGLIK